MSKKNKSKKKGNLIERYNKTETKKKVVPSMMKMGVDFAGVAAGAFGGSVFGILSPFIGILTMGIGHFAGDKTGLTRIAGAAMTAYGLATAKENRDAANATTVSGVSLSSMTQAAKERVKKLGDNWLYAFYVDKLVKKKDSTITDEQTVGAIDLSALDEFEKLAKEAAIKHEVRQIDLQDTQDGLDQQGSDYFEDETGQQIPVSLPADQEYDLSTI